MSTEQRTYCADLAETFSYGGFVCELEPGHYPATPHEALRHSAEPDALILWDDSGTEIKNWLVRAEVEALMNENGARIAALTNRGVHLDGGEILMTRIKAMLDHLIGDMDSQPRLAFELALAQQYRQAIDVTEPQVEKALLAQRLNGGGTPPTSPGGIILPS